MKKFERVVSVCFVAAFVLFLAVMCAGTCTGDRLSRTASYFENRALAERPEWSVQAVLDGSCFTQLEDFLSDHVIGRNALVWGSTLLDLAAGRPVVNEVVVQRDILLPWWDYETVDAEEVACAARQMADNLQSVNELVASYGGKYCYVAVPSQYDYFADRYPDYLENREEYIRESMEQLSRCLTERGVDFLDMGAVFDAQGHPDGFFSVVDHHYSMFGAYETYLAMMERLGCSDAGVPILTEEDFTYTRLELPYQGSRGRKLLNLWKSDERLFYLTLKEDVPFTRIDNGQERSAAVYAFPGAGDTWVTYGLYMGGDVANTVIDTGRDELPSILIYGDSFTNALESITYWSFDEMHSLDLRYTGEDVTLGEYIRTYQPEYVVCVRDYSAALRLTENGTGVN